jgi:MoaA/NifB/PqqE/SkfB family radical SAM enzyme
LVLQETFVVRHLTGLAKWLKVGQGILASNTQQFPLGFTAFALKMMANEKMTVIDGRVYVKAGYPVLGTRAYKSVLDGLSRISRGEHRLLSVSLSVTSRCTMGCFYCFAKAWPKGPELSTSRLIQLIKEAQDLGAYSIHFSGGEPMLRADLPELIASVDSRSNSLLLTSGFNFPRMSRQLRDAGLDSVLISLDTFDESKYNARRGHKNAYGIAVEAAREAINCGFYTGLGMTPDESMLEPTAFKKYVETAGRLGVHEVRVYAPRPSVALGRDGFQCFSRAQIDRLRRFQFQFNRVAGLPTVTSMDYEEYPQCHGCRAGTLYGHVSAVGEVTPCPISPMSFGNISQRPLSKVYENMRRYIPQPPPRCLLPDIYRLIRDEPDDGLPVPEPAKVDRVFRQLDIKNMPAPAFHRKLLKK